jgi:DNA replication protein DnaC
MKMIEGVQSLAHELRLFGVHASAERRCQEATAENLHPTELIRLLLEDERDRRREITAKRLATRAKFRTGAVLEDWDFSAKRGFSKAKFKELALLNFYYKKQNLVVVGKTGLGKTHLSIAIGKRLCDEGVSTAFYSTNLFLEEAQAEKAAGRYLKLITRLKKIQVLIFDDFALRRYSHDEANILLELIEERYQKGINIISSQVSPRGWSDLFEDSVISEAICDRLVNPSEIVELDGDSYRKNIKTVEGKIVN